MAGAWARKKSQEVPIQGVIVNDETLESETDKTLTIDAIKRLTHGNSLIINGDFQINQRGQSEYNTTSYSLDMWYLNLWNTTGKVTKTNNGIRITNTSSFDGLGFYQYTNENNSIAKEMTLSLKVDGIVHTISGIPTNSGTTPTITSEKFDANIRYYEDNNRYRVYVSVKANSYVDIEYIDLFEGNIAYPHVKEDYAIALLRCQQYLKKMYVVGEVTNAMVETDGYILVPFELGKMHTKPTFLIYDDNKNVNKCTRTTMGKNYNNESGRIYGAYIDADYWTCELISDSGTKAISIKALVIASCEPL